MKISNLYLVFLELKHETLRLNVLFLDAVSFSYTSNIANIVNDVVT